MQEFYEGVNPFLDVKSLSNWRLLFAMVKPNPGDKLEDIEFDARNEWDQNAFRLEDIVKKQEPASDARKGGII